MKRIFKFMVLAVVCASCATSGEKDDTMTATTQTGENAVVDAIMGRRSIRKYLDTPVEHEKLETVVKCGIYAPNGMNRQPWEIAVVESQEMIAKATEIFVKEQPEMVERDANFKNMFRNAPNLICVASPIDGSGNVDAGLLGENMMLAAYSLGLGTCCLGGPVAFLKSNRESQWFIDALGFSDDYTLNYIIAIGYPDETPEVKPRDESKIKYVN